MPEPWLRGLQISADPIVAPVLFALQQVREDLTERTVGLSAEQIWLSPGRMPSLGFHLRHIAGSLDRLTTYLQGNQLSEGQCEELQSESAPGADLPELLSGVKRALSRTEEVITAIDPGAYREPRSVGRLKLPTTVIGLIIHIAEHTQRHCGQVITTAAFLRNS